MSKRNCLEVAKCCWEDGEPGFGRIEECQTPKQGKHGIEELLMCPPPPRKKRPLLKSRDPPSAGYFNPPDLELLLSEMKRRVCA